MIPMNLFANQKQTHIEKTHDHHRGKGRGRDQLEIWD